MQSRNIIQIGELITYLKIIVKRKQRLISFPRDKSHNRIYFSISDATEIIVPTWPYQTYDGTSACPKMENVFSRQIHRAIPHRATEKRLHRVYHSTNLHFLSKPGFLFRKLKINKLSILYISHIPNDYILLQISLPHYSLWATAEEATSLSRC